MQYCDSGIEMTIKGRCAVWKANTRTWDRRQQWVGPIPWGHYPSHHHYSILHGCAIDSDDPLWNFLIFFPPLPHVPDRRRVSDLTARGTAFFLLVLGSYCFFLIFRIEIPFRYCWNETWEIDISTNFGNSSLSYLTCISWDH